MNRRLCWTERRMRFSAGCRIQCRALRIALSASCPWWGIFGIRILGRPCFRAGRLAGGRRGSRSGGQETRLACWLLCSERLARPQLGGSHKTIPGQNKDFLDWYLQLRSITKGVGRSMVINSDSRDASSRAAARSSTQQPVTAHVDVLTPDGTLYSTQVA